MTRETLAEQTADTLRQSIRDGAYSCGERLIELTLAHELRVSQNTIREALRILEHEGWLLRHPRRGVFVRSFTPDEAEEVYALWASLESLALHWAWARISRVELLAELRPPVARARTYVLMGRWTAAREMLFAFHGSLCHLAQKPRTAAMLNQLHNQARLLDVDFEFNLPRPPEEHTRQIEAYEHLIGVIKFSEPESAERALHEHILALGKPVVRWLAMNT